GPSARFNLISNVVSGSLYYSFAFKATDLGALSSSGSYFAGFNNSRGPQTGTPFVLGTRILAALQERTPSDWAWPKTQPMPSSGCGQRTTLARAKQFSWSAATPLIVRARQTISLRSGLIRMQPSSVRINHPRRL